MGILSWFTRGVTDPIPSFAPASVWQESTLNQNVILSDVVGQNFKNFATRYNAMQVPAIVKARNIICTNLAAAEFKQFKGETETQTQPRWLYSTGETGMTPWHRMTWIADDLFFYGWSLLVVRRGANKEILDAARVPRERWDFDSFGRVEIDGELAQQTDSLVLIPGPFEGILVTGAGTIHGALDLERSWQSRVRNPIAVTELHNTDINAPLSPTESKALVTQWNTNRKSDDGVTAYTPANVEVRTHGSDTTDLFIAGRNAVAIDVARLANLPAVLLDAANVNASNQTYQTKENARNDLVDAIRNTWGSAIEARLSMDDVVPRGNTIRGDYTNLLTLPTTPTTALTED